MSTLAGTRLLSRAANVVRPRAPERNTEWFEQLYESTVDSVYRYAVTLLRDASRAEDLVSEAYLKAWRSRSGLRDESRVLPWLMTITHNLAISQMRGSREVADIGALPEQADRAADPAAPLLAADDAATLQAAMRLLTADQQEVVFLRFYEGLSHDEVADRLGRNSNAVRAIQFRALGRLRKLLEGHNAELA